MTGNEHKYDLWRWARYRAKRDGLEFTIQPHDIEIGMYCPILDIKMDKNVGVSSSTSPTLDRVDNTRGYTKDNIRVISNLANIMKSSADEKTLHKFAQWIISQKS